jgi:MFS transporter, MHS family, proline/betaine transporter
MIHHIKLLIIEELNRLKKFSGTTLDFLKTSFGNIIEWYDFSLYGIFAVSIASAFFPSSNKFISMMMVFLTFSVSFIARPMGSIIFGYIGDKFGTHYSVNISVWCMAVPTVVVGLLPTYQQIGIIAPIVLIFLRFLQGISVGGQISGLITIAVESTKTKRSFLVSLILSIAILGGLLASIIGLLSQSILGGYSKELAWRVPFILSGLLFIIYLKIKPDHEKHVAPGKFSISAIFKEQPSEVFYMVMLAATMACMYYVLFSYFVPYLQVYTISAKHAPLIAMNILLGISLFGYPIAGKLADTSSNRIKLSKNFVLVFCFGAILLSLNQSFWWAIGCLFIMIMAYCFLASYVTGMFAEIFDEKYRMTACSICYSGGAVFGGFSPLISEVLASKSFGGFFMYLLCLGFATYLILDKITLTDGYKKFIA